MQLILHFILVATLSLAQSAAGQTHLPAHHPFNDEYRPEWEKAYKDWKPGVQVAKILHELADREGELNQLYFEGDTTLEKWAIESQRIKIHRHLVKCLGFAASPQDEAFDLIVIRTTREELMRVFPSGQLPEKELQPNRIYPTDSQQSRKVRYLTIYRWDNGDKFAVFARERD